MVRGTPPAEIVVTEARVEALISEQLPEYADLPVRYSGEGWDNYIFRLGDTFSVRLPRRAIAVPLLTREQRFLPLLAPRLPSAVPVTVATGQPGCGFPWIWSVCRWIEGEPIDIAPLDADQGPALAEFLRALHQPADDDAPLNSLRGLLADRREETAARLARLRASSDLVTSHIERIWREAIEARPASSRVWLHGDFHAQNALSRLGALAGVIDWGDMCAGDAAVDLSGVWALLASPGARNEALRTYQPSEDMLARAKGWAIALGAVIFEHGREDNPRHAAMGEAMLRRVADVSSS